MFSASTGISTRVNRLPPAAQPSSIAAAVRCVGEHHAELVLQQTMAGEDRSRRDR